jgi:type II secretory pathway component PulK
MFALMVMAILSIGTSVLWSQIHSQLSQQRQSWHREQAFQLAEAGLEQADVLLGPGHFTVTVMAANEAGAYQIESWGALDLAAYRYDRAGLRAELTLSPSGRLERYAVQPIKGEP